MERKKLESHINDYIILVKEKENYINYLENILRDNNIHYKNHLPEYSTSNDIYQDILDNNIEKEVKLELDLKKTSHTINEDLQLEDKPITTNIEIDKNTLSKKKMTKLEKRRQKKLIQEMQYQYMRIIRK